MSLVSIPGGFTIPIGPGFLPSSSSLFINQTTMDAADEAIIFVGSVLTSDGGSHTIDTTGSSSLGWRALTVTFANAGTTVKVGLAAVSTTTGPAARAANVANVVTFDVSKSIVGGGGGITGSAWQTHVPDSGSKTIANGDLVAFVVQMTARAGADSVQAGWSASDERNHRPVVTEYSGGTYTAQLAIPNCIITFSDGAIGYFQGSDVANSITTRTWNSGSATKEYGQLFQLPFPAKVCGFYGWVDPDNDFDLVLYSDPLGTPVAERTVSIDANTVANTAQRRFVATIATPFSVAPGQKIGAVFKPGGSNISAFYKTLASATHRASDSWGTSGYGISRASGAFADANSSLDHYYIGLLVSAFEHGVQPNYVLGL